jgi:ArsR family transcriptional regulator, arsenate/arsenite/antimonite-responsive transcriptional repressor
MKMCIRMHIVSLGPALDGAGRDDHCMIVQVTKRRAASPDVGESLPMDLFKALGDTTRIALVAWLATQKEPRTVTEIASGGCCAVDLSVVSRHLAVLRDAGVLEAEKRGREVLYRLRARSLATALRRMADALESCCSSHPEKE